MKKSSEIASSLNKKAIVALLREKGPMSKADLSRALHLSFPAVSYNTKKLIEEHVICEIGTADNALGRKGTLLAFNARLSYLAGADIGRNHIRAMCADMGGTILAYRSREIRPGEDVIRQAAACIRAAAEKAGVEMEDVACLGIGTPGIYDPETDSLRFAPFAETWGKGILQRLKSEFQMDIVIENSVNLGAIGERWKGEANGFDDILYVDLGVGIGSAVLIDGTLIRGKNGAFGEIAYMLLDKNRLPGSFLEEGALEKLLPSRRIGDLIARFHQEESQTGIRSIIEQMKKSGEFPGIEDVPAYFAMSLANTITVTNPALLVIAGRLGCALYRAYQEEIDSLIRQSVPFPPLIRCTGLSEKAGVYGAIAAAMLHSNAAYTDFRQFI